MLFDTQQPLNSDNQPEQLREILKKCKDCMDSAEPVHKVYRDRWDELYGLYRNYNKLKQAYSEARDSDRANILGDARREWGAELFIPWAYSIVETVIPRLLSNDPTMLVRPRSPDAQQAAEAVQQLIAAQQADIGYELKLQPTARRGLMYGLGAQKTFWNKKTRKVIRTVASAAGPTPQNPQGLQAVEQEIVLYEGPDVMDVDIWDFFWDPIAYSIESARWVIHRTWKDDDYVAKMSGNAWYELDLERVKAMKSEASRDAAWQGRREAAGMTGTEEPKSDRNLHEVWEYHNGEEVYTVLDRSLVVQYDQAPTYHREIPFQIFRPTAVPGEFVGIGEIEPIKNLQKELNTLRGQRRDNATMALMRAFIYREGRADPDTFRLGPGVGIPVQGDPRNDIVPLTFPDLPASSYQEESAIKQDMELASGISETTAGGAGSGDTAGTDTATGVQLVQQAANVRIRLKTRNLERETITPAGRQFLELNRQHILDPKPVRVDNPSEPNGYSFQTVGPQQLLSDLEDPIPDAGSTEPDNKVERQQNASNLFAELSTSPLVNQQKLLLHLLKELDVPNPESFIQQQQQGPQLDPVIMGTALKELGVDPDTIQKAIELTLQAEQSSQDQIMAEHGGQAPPPSAGQ